MDVQTLSVPDAARVLGISRLSAYRAASRGEIPTLRLGKRLVVPKAALEEMLRNPSGHAATAGQAAREAVSA